VIEQVSWADLKAFAARIGASRRIRYVIRDDRHIAWLSDGAVTVIAKFRTGDADGLDFTTTAIPLIHVDPITHDNLNATRSLKYDPVREPFQVGYQFTITDDSGPNILDVLIDPGTMVGADGFVQLLGGRIWAPSDATEDDTLDAVVVDKTGVVPDTIDGLHTSLMDHFGLPTDGSAALEVSEKFTKDRNLDVGDPHGSGMEPGGNFEILGGLYVRVIYNATKGSAYTKKVRLNLHFAK
jgi:hypothetical protein